MSWTVYHLTYAYMPKIVAPTCLDQLSGDIVELQRARKIFQMNGRFARDLRRWRRDDNDVNGVRRASKGLR
jgi:hypothetical protein